MKKKATSSPGLYTQCQPWSPFLSMCNISLKKQKRIQQLGQQLDFDDNHFPCQKMRIGNRTAILQSLSQTPSKRSFFPNYWSKLDSSYKTPSPTLTSFNFFLCCWQSNDPFLPFFQGEKEVWLQCISRVLLDDKKPTSPLIEVSATRRIVRPIKHWSQSYIACSVQK